MSLGAAVVGLGNISRGHLAAWEKIQGAQLRAVCDVVEERANDIGAKLGIASYTDIDALLARPDIHIVDLCLPPAAHAPMATKVLRAGKNAIVEKPIALNLDDAAQMQEEAVRAGVQLGVISQLRFSSHVRQLKRWLDEGRLGRPIAVHLELKGYGRDSSESGPKAYLRSAALSGGGILMQVGIHHVDMMRYLLGEVSQVTWAHVENLAHPHSEVEDYTLAHVTFLSGAHGLIESGSVWPTQERRQTRLTIATERFTVVVERDRIVDIASADGETLQLDAYDPGTHGGQLQNFVDSVANGTTCAITGSDGAQSLALVLAIYEAGKSGSPVALDSINERLRESV